MIKDYELKKVVLINEQGLCCASCGEMFEPGQKIDLAHKIISSEANKKLFGEEVINHIMNLAATHANGYKGKACNDKQVINRATRPIEADCHIKRIQKELSK